MNGPFSNVILLTLNRYLSFEMYSLAQRKILPNTDCKSPVYSRIWTESRLAVRIREYTGDLQSVFGSILRCVVGQIFGLYTPSEHKIL